MGGDKVYYEQTDSSVTPSRIYWIKISSEPKQNNRNEISFKGDPHDNG